MKFFILVTLFLGTALAFPQVMHPSDQKSQINGRIVNGVPAATNQFPWQAAIVVTQTGGNQVLCGGVLVSNAWVLTAAHCTVAITNFEIRLGSNNFSAPSVTFNTKNYIRHPNYNAVNLQNNIALILLPSDVNFTASINQILLPPQSQLNANLTGQPASVSGFGRVSDSSTVISNTLQYTNVSVISNTECAAIFGNAVVTDLTVCARGLDSVSQNICNGDDGGPLVQYQGLGETPILIGLISFISGAGCASGYPSGHVRISQYVGWINSHTGIPIRP